MRKISIILLTLLLCLSVRTYAVDIDVRASARVGAIMPDGKVFKSAGQAKDGWTGPVYGGEIALAFRPEWRSLEEWNGAAVGVALDYWYLDSKRLGHAIAPYVFWEIPFLRRPHFVMGVRAAIGAAFLTETYRTTVPEGHLFLDVANANQSIGSVFNFYFPETFFMEFPLRRGWSITTGLGWYHMSNGSIRQPNSGYNIFGAEVGARYTPPMEYAHIVRPNRGLRYGREKRWELEAAVTAGARQVYYGDNQTFVCGEAQVAAFWRAHNIFRLGGGVDAFYDGSYVQRETRFQKTDLKKAAANGSDCWRLGVSLQPEFVIGHFTAGFHVGFYVLDPIKNLEPYKDVSSKPQRLNRGIFYSYDIVNAGSAGYADGWLYTQIVLRYHLPYHLMVQAAMKAHITKVEFVSLGLGVWL